MLKKLKSKKLLLISLLLIVVTAVFARDRLNQLIVLGTSKLYGALTVGPAAGRGVDVTFYSGTSGDDFLWDASEEVLNITGTDNQDALQVDDGDVSITDDAMIGTVNWGGTADNDAGTDTYNITVDPAPGAYKTGQFFYFIPDTINTGTCSLDVNTLGNKGILTASGAAPANSDFVTTTVSHVVYNGTNFILLNPATSTD